MVIRIKKSTLIVVLVIGLVFITQFVYANNREPGSAEDPIVTLSYVEQRLEQLEQKLRASQQPSAGKSTLEVVELKRGQSLIAGAGTEIILRGGSAVVVQGAQGGLSDVTGAKHVRGNEAISLNHLNIVPRDDGRGVRATSDAILMVRGEYRLQ